MKEFIEKQKIMNNETILTDLERRVIKNLLGSEYMAAPGVQMINWSVWSFSVTGGSKQLAGALGSLVKKGLCSCDISEGDETCALTREGFTWVKSNGLIP